MTSTRESISPSSSVRMGQSYGEVLESIRKGTLRYDDARQRACGQMLAVTGLAQREYLQGSSVPSDTIKRINWFDQIWTMFKAGVSENKPLSADLTRALAETDEGKQWTKEANADTLKTLLQSAFAPDKPQPKIISREGNLIKVIKVGDEEITITSPYRVLQPPAHNQYQNFKISSVNAKDQTVKRTTIFNSLDKDLFSKLDKFRSDNFDTNRGPELHSSSDPAAVLEDGTLVNANLHYRAVDNSGSYIDTIELYLKYNNQFYYFTCKYKHPKYDPYIVDGVYKIEDANGEEVKVKGVKELVKDLIQIDLKNFNESYNISFD